MPRSIQCCLSLICPLIGLSFAMSEFRATAVQPKIQSDSIAVKVRSSDVEVVYSDDTPIFKYQLQLPKESKLAVESACFFHPLCTPSGIAVTDLAPADHPHHRGVFFGFVEMRGANHDADFWGWGEHAPKDDRKIMNVGKEVTNLDLKVITMEFENAWKVGDVNLVDERLTARVERVDAANVLDLEYHLTPREDIRLPRWAFSGFCVRLRKDGKIAYTSPKGVVDRPALNHMKPELDWPAEPWYDATVTLEDGKQVGVTVVDHPKNPPCLWHNEKNIHMINPCIVAPGEVKLTAGKPLVLSYRLVVHDGPAPVELAEKLAKEFREAKHPAK
jgi:hypothetical protein